ncbi:MAG: hypothetical protein KC636_31715, partial [Myxococcales bacterium]|nr:hypothetical protein [Myxococcales bacterium]
MRPFTLLPWPRALRSAHARARLRVCPLALLLTVPACDAVLNPADPVDHATVVGEREHIAIPDVLAESANIVPDDTPYLPGYHRGQVRVIINEGEVDEEMALYTVSEVFDPGAAQQVDVFVWDDPNNGASTDGKERLELGAGALSGSPLPAVVLEDTVTTDDCTDAVLDYGLVECLRGDAITIMNMSESYLFIAPHGGAIELHTDDQARAAHSHTFVDGNMMNFDMEDHSLAWYLNGWRSGGGAYRHWHITSTEIGRRSFPQLDLIGP